VARLYRGERHLGRWRFCSSKTVLIDAFIYSITGDARPLPPPLTDADEDAALFDDDPWVEAPIHIDYGTNVRPGANVFINFNCAIVDTCLVTIGSRTLFGPNVSLFSGSHPLDPALRNGTQGPEMGKEIHIGEDCWLGGNVIILPGVRIGKGCTIGAGSVVTKDVPPYHVAAGNPARILRKVETEMDPEQRSAAKSGNTAVEGAEEPMSQMASKLG